MKYSVALDLEPEQVTLIKRTAIEHGMTIKYLVRSILLMCLEQNIIIEGEKK